MDNLVNTKQIILDEVESRETERSPRPRKATMLKLQWLSERLRKCERIKREIQAGTYRVDSEEVAKALLNLNEESR